MPRRPSVLLLSIALHAVVVIVIASADLWRPITDWPTPRSALAFLDDTRVVRLDDVALPPAHETGPRSESTPGTRRTVEAAPLAQPEGVSPDLHHENITGEVCACGPGGLADSAPGSAFGLPEMPPPPPVPQPRTPPIRLHSGIKPPARLVSVPPAYPAMARLAHQEGIVIIEATIDEQGNVTETHILRSIPLLDESAVAAVRQWKFSPTLLNGVPVSIVMTVTVNFKLTQ
jgi:TonB family protein